MKNMVPMIKRCIKDQKEIYEILINISGRTIKKIPLG